MPSMISNIYDACVFSCLSGALWGPLVSYVATSFFSIFFTSFRKVLLFITARAWSMESFPDSGGRCWLRNAGERVGCFAQHFIALLESCPGRNFDLELVGRPFFLTSEESSAIKRFVTIRRRISRGRRRIVFGDGFADGDTVFFFIFHL